MSVNLGSATAYLDLDASKFERGMKNTLAGLKTFNDKTLSTSDRFSALGKTFTSVGKQMTLGVTAPLAGIGVASAKAAIDFESAFTGVKKTVDGTEAQMKKLEKGIKDMAKEMPTAATEIAGVAEAAGQLGIKTDDILGFTKTMVMLGDSTNMSAEEAATSLARLANITGMSQKDFDKLGSTIVALGNNLATTESEITTMGLRLAAAGKQVGMSEHQIMSFAGALSSVGIEAEAGGTAFSKVMVEIQLAAEKGGEKLNNFAKVAGMSAQDFKKAFEEDAATAIMKFIEGLGSAEERGMSAIGILDEMGISEVRLRDSLLRAAGASDVFSEALEIGSNAWNENNALTNEAEQRYETTASKLLILKNNIIDVGISIGETLLPYIQSFIEWLQGLIQKFQDLSPETQDFIVKAGLIAAAIGPLLMLIGSLIQVFTMVGGAISTVTGLFTGFGGAATAAGGAATVVTAGASALASVLTGGLIFALVGVIAKIGESSTALGWLQDKFGSLGTVIGGVCEFIAGIWNITIDNIINVGKLGFDVLAAMIDGPGGATVKDAFGKYTKGVEEINKKAWDNITLTTTRELSQQKNSVDKETGEAKNKADKNTKDMAKAMGDNAKKGADDVSKNMKQTSKVVMDESGKIPKDVQANMNASVQAMRQAGSDIYNGMNTSFSKLASQGKQHFTDLYNGTTRSSSKMASQVIADWDRIKSALSSTITGNVQIKVHGVQQALNQINSVKNAAKKSSVMADSIANPNLDSIMLLDEVGSMLRSDSMASYVASGTSSTLDVNVKSSKNDKKSLGDIKVDINIDKFENKTNDSPIEFADKVIDRVVYKLKRERIAIGGA